MLDASFFINPPVSDKAIDELENATGFQLPSSYRKFMNVGNGGEGIVGPSGYLAIWPVETVMDRYRGYEFDKYMPNFIPIGSDGGGEALVIRFIGNRTEFGYLPFGDLSDKNFIFISDDLYDCISRIGRGDAEIGENGGAKR